jgi:hypothetical protein
MKKVLFLTKKGLGYSGTYSYNSSGLLNSATFVVDMLTKHGIEAKLEIVQDNNDIDREVFKYRPDIVVIEALWVVPSKFLELSRLHPSVQWIVRLHSDIPFLSQEGVAMSWMCEYVQQPNVYVGFNKHTTLESLAHIVPREKLVYLPNYFPAEGHGPRVKIEKHWLNVGCFGAIRPLKNQLIQALAAIQYADETGQTLHFHINSTRVEGGTQVLKNLRSLFYCSRHKLIEHVWHSHRAFQAVLERMDISLCVSLSETFCIVAADSVSLGVPLVCSSQVPWAYRGSIVNPTDSKGIAEGIHRIITWKHFYTTMNRRGLKAYDKASTKVWSEFLS